MSEWVTTVPDDGKPHHYGSVTVTAEPGQSLSVTYNEGSITVRNESSVPRMTGQESSRYRVMRDLDTGLTATVYSVEVAVEHNPDGSVTICKELVDDILADKETPEFVRRMLRSGTTPNRYGEPTIIHKVE